MSTAKLRLERRILGGIDPLGARYYRWNIAKEMGGDWEGAAMTVKFK